MKTFILVYNFQFFSFVVVFGSLCVVGFRVCKWFGEDLKCLLKTSNCVWIQVASFSICETVLEES